jgi:predicted Rossmann fold nucleotide-binding protein DprA/Smf involved in DNA uptake
MYKYIGIIGSRRRYDKDSVFKLVDCLPLDCVVVSGGCRGVDTWAEIRAKQRGLKTLVFRPDLSNIKNRYDMIQRYYERNKKIAQHSDVIVAFVAPDRRGGTENTIKWAKMFGKKVVIK